jgi:hypothetical protein
MSEMEMLLVRPRDGAPPGVDEQIAEWTATHDGLILMATAAGSLVVALPRAHKEQLRAHPLVGFVGGVTLQGDGKAARALKQRFAENAARQLVQRHAPASAEGRAVN